jgi:signal transduction histidine kinase
MMKRSLPLRLRLTLLSTALVGVTLFVFSLAVYLTLAQAFWAEVDRSLVDRARVVTDSVTVGRTSAGRPFVDLSGVDAITGAVVQAVLADGTIVRSDTLGRYSLPVSREALAEAASGQVRFENVQVAGQDLRLYNGPLRLGDTTIGMLQVARPVGPTEAALARLRLILAAGAVGSVAICALLGLLVARAALRPIDRLTREAERIGETQDFSRRVAIKPGAAPDEVGRLAATFNGMLDRLQSAYGALQRANERLEAALQSQRRFVADASHELRTPLTTVRGNASLLRRLDMLTPEDRQAAVEQIVAESERMSRLVNDLLVLARADAGQLLERKPVALGPLIEAVAQQGRVLSEGRHAISVVRVAGVDAEVLGDADALRQLLLILVDNAIKYTPAGGSITLGLRVEFGAGGTRLAHIAVVDTGVGIAPEDLPHIFERFYRADRARRAGGTGLGLAIGKWIAEAHGGRITVESSPGAGSIFTVTLPATSHTLSQQRQPLDAETASAVTPSLHPWQAGHSPALLHVDGRPFACRPGASGEGHG